MSNWRETFPEKCSNCPLVGPEGAFRFLVQSSHWSEVSRCSTLRTYHKNGLIIQQGDPIDGWSVLRRGTARLFISDRQGREHTVKFAHPGALIGGCPADFLGEPHGNCYSAVAETEPTEVCHFPRGVQLRLFQDCPALAQAFLDLMVRHLSDSYRRLHLLTTTTVEERLADALVRLADAHLHVPGSPVTGGNQSAVTIHLARRQLADILGVAKETAVRALGSLKKRGLVETKGRAITVRDIEALRRIAASGQQQ